MSKRQIGVTLYDFMLKLQSQAINKNAEETSRMQYKRLIKRKRGKDKDGQEGGPTFMNTTSATVQEVCVFEKDRARERAKAEDKGKREKRQRAAEKANKNRNSNYEGDSGWEEEDAVAPSSGKKVRGSGSGSDSNKVGSERSRAIAKSRRGEISSNSKNGSKHNSGSRTLQMQGQR